MLRVVIYGYFTFYININIGKNTVQLGYCDSDVTVCLLFWNMPIIQDRDIKLHISDIHIIYKHIRLKAIVSQWFHR